jgi:CubicO group peptidase (beta-lactamase class C family)
MRGWLIALPALLSACAAPGQTKLAHPAHAAPAVGITPANVLVEFNDRRITSAKVSGDAGVAGRAVSADDPVRVASISKLVTAMAAMRLVDDGKLDLDRDINGYLGYSIRNPAFPDVPITMRLLLTHRSSIKDGIDYILPLDGEISSVLANPQAWHNDHAPGSWFNYANLNSPVIGATLEAASGERFDRLVARTVLTPLKIDGCFNWMSGCSVGRRMQAVTLLRPNGDLAKDAAVSAPEPCTLVPSSDGSCDLSRYRLGRNGSAFSPQGGLRISANDLVKIGQVLLNKGRPILSAKAFAEMTKVQWQFDGTNGDDEQGYFKTYGIGIHMQSDAAGTIWWGHVGEAYSLRAGLWVNPKTGKGLARYVTMVDEFAPVGHCLDSCP